jgi:hypothetical protein
MKLLIVPARQGLVWFQMGVRTFLKQPLAFTGLFFMFMAAISLLAVIPVLGNLAALALLHRRVLRLPPYKTSPSPSSHRSADSHQAKSPTAPPAPPPPAPPSPPDPTNNPPTPPLPPLAPVTASPPRPPWPNQPAAPPLPPL